MVEKIVIYFQSYIALITLNNNEFCPLFLLETGKPEGKY